MKVEFLYYQQQSPYIAEEAMTVKQSYNALLGQKLVAEFQKRNFEGYYCDTKEIALKKALELIPKDAIVSCGGSATLYEIVLL